MKQIILAASFFTATFSFAQEIKISESSSGFSNGSHNSIIVSIPFAKKDMVESALRSEMKDWGGKYNSSKGEYTAIGASMKAMGEKPFDGYAKIIESGSEIQVAFAVDLGGAYMDSKMHSAQYKVIQERVMKFAKKAATESIEEDLSAETKLLKGLNSDKSDLEKSTESAKKDIEDYKKRIADAEQKIKDNESALSKKADEIKTQEAKIAEVEKKKKALK